MDRQGRESDVRDGVGEPNSPNSRLPRKTYTSPRLTTYGSITQYTAFLVTSGLPT